MPHRHKAIWNSCKGSASDRVAQEVFRITKEERDCGWLEGPFYDDLPMDAILTRRFGVEQSSTRADGSVVSKVRPVDDYTESQVNLTNSCDETVSPHGVDTIVAGACLRVISRPKDHAPENLLGCTIDLRKAYKQLAIHPKSLNDAYLCVFDTEAGTPAAFKTLVLPFGARAAVNGFCRCSLALFWIGVVLLQLHWSVFFNDFFVLFVDNQAALSCLISGRAEGVASYLLQRLLELEESHDLNFWFEWVPSESNPADAPSMPLGSSSHCLGW